MSNDSLDVADIMREFARALIESQAPVHSEMLRGIGEVRKDIARFETRLALVEANGHDRKLEQISERLLQMEIAEHQRQGVKRAVNWVPQWIPWLVASVAAISAWVYSGIAGK